jgi:DNA-binding IclR family transcriptional regulator
VTMNGDDGRRASIRSVERAARILKALGGGSARLGVTELADQLGLAKATVHGLLRTLEQQEFVERELGSSKYRLGPALLQLGNAYLDTHELRARSLMWADSLASRAGEAVRVGVVNGENILIVHHVFRPDDSVQILEVGASIPWFASALGKAVVAYLDTPRRERLLASTFRPLTGGTITDPDRLREVLVAVTRDGYAVEDQEAIVGEAEIASPVFDHRGVVTGAVGLVGPVERLVHLGQAPETLVSLVKETARGLSRDMGAGRLASRGG